MYSLMVNFYHFNSDYVYENCRILVPLSCVILALAFWWYSKEKKYEEPPGPQGVPILGYLPFLSKEPFRDFHNLSKRYGNVFSLYLGHTHVVILGNYEAVKEAFSKSATLDRPESVFDFIPDGVGFSSMNGEEWVEQRKFALKSMRELGLGRSTWENLVQEEVEDFVKVIYQHNGNSLNISRILTASVFNNVGSLIFGKRMALTDSNIDFVWTSLNNLFLAASQTNWRLYFPNFYDKLAAWGVISIPTASIEIQNFHNYVRKEVELCKKSYVPGGTSNFVEGYLTEQMKFEQQNLPHFFNEKNLHGNVQSLMLGGSDTTRTSIMWLLLSMATYLDIQEKVHKEIDTVLGKDGKIQWSERASLPYTFAVIMEGQRWRTIAPLNTSRLATADIKIGNYDIRKGTTIIANIWGLHYDVSYWKNPEKFIPERFLLEGGKKVNFQAESYVPFSYGKRNCPAESVALIEILLYFTAFMQNFDVLPPVNETLQLDGILGLTYQPISLNLRFVPRK